MRPLISYLQKKVSDTLDRIKSPAQYAGLVSLYDFYKKCVYPPAKVKNENMVEVLAEGFCNVMCDILWKEALTTLKKKSVVADIDTNDLIARLAGNSDSDQDKWENFETLDIWTDSIDGSDTDVYEHEVGRSHMPKRILKPEFFQTGWLEKRFKLGAERISHDARKECTEPPPLGEWWVALDGQKNGPHDESGLSSFIAAGRMVLSTKVWKKGMSGWVPAEHVKELDNLFHQPPPLDDEPPPIE